MFEDPQDIPAWSASLFPKTLRSTTPPLYRPEHQGAETLKMCRLKSKVAKWQSQDLNSHLSDSNFAPSKKPIVPKSDESIATPWGIFLKIHIARPCPELLNLMRSTGVGNRVESTPHVVVVTGSLASCFQARGPHHRRKYRPEHLKRAQSGRTRS